MLKRTILLIPALAVLLLVAGACASSPLDSGDGPDVIMEVVTLENPAVTASLDTATNVCTFTLSDWRFDVRNEPKNSLATTVYNDIELISVTIAYEWFPAVPVVIPDRVIGLGHTAVATEETAEVTFSPIAFDDLSATLAGHTANLTMTFFARTIEGTPITKTVLRQLHIEGCV